MSFNEQCSDDLERTLRDMQLMEDLFGDRESEENKRIFRFDDMSDDDDSIVEQKSSSSGIEPTDDSNKKSGDKNDSISKEAKKTAEVVFDEVTGTHSAVVQDQQLTIQDKDGNITFCLSKSLLEQWAVDASDARECAEENS